MKFLNKIFILFLIGFLWRVLFNSCSLDSFIICLFSFKTFCFDNFISNPSKVLNYFFFVWNNIKPYFLHFGFNIDCLLPLSIRAGNSSYIMMMNKDSSPFSNNINGSIHSSPSEILIKRGQGGGVSKYSVQEWQNFARVERDWYNRMELRAKEYMTKKANSYVANNPILDKSKPINAADYDVDRVVSVGKVYSSQCIDSIKATWDLDMVNHPTNINQKILDDIYRKNIRTFLSIVVSK